MKQDFGIVGDWETSGLPEVEVPTRTYLEGPQGIEIGAILVHLPTFEPIAEFESRVRFLGSAFGVPYGGPIYEELTWDANAEKIHGISVADLKNAPTPTEVADNLVTWIRTNASLDGKITLCGHNPAFDSYFTRQLLFLGAAEKKVRIHHRLIDSFSLGYMLWGCKSSDDLFRHVSGANRKIHSAIEDSRLTLEAFRHIYKEMQDSTSSGKRGKQAHE